MNHKKEKHYQDLYIEYKRLRKETALTAQTLKPGGIIDIKSISVKDVARKIKVGDELLAGLKFLSDDQLIDLAGDYRFDKEANNILIQRRMLE